MSRSLLLEVVQAVVRRASRQGSVGPKDVREELIQANLPDSLWKDMVRLAGPALGYRRGRYHYLPAGTSRMRARLKLDQRHQQEIHKGVCQLLGQKRRSNLKGPDERRAFKRVDLVRPVQVQTEDGRILHLLTRNISLSGIRLVSTVALQGKKVKLWIEDAAADSLPLGFKAHILWSSVVGDNLIESGGIFLEKVQGQPRFLRLANAE